MATGILEGTALAMMGIVLFQLRRRAGLIPLLFLLAALSLAVPFVAHSTLIDLGETWTVGRTFVVVLPVFMALVLVLHTLTGPKNARIAGTMPLAAGFLAAGALWTSQLTPLVLPDEVLPSSAITAIATGALLSIATLYATGLFEWWHKDVGRAPFAMILFLSTMSGLLVHGLFAEGASLVGLTLPGVAWPSIVATPLVVGAGPVLFISLYADTLLSELKPLAARGLERERLLGEPADLEVYREAEERYHRAVEEGFSAAEAYQDLLPSAQERGLILCDRRGQVVHATEHAGRILHRDAEDLVGRDAEDLLFGANSQLLPHPAPNGHEAPSADRILWRTDAHDRVLEVHAEEMDSGALRLELNDVTEATLRERLADHQARTRLALDLVAQDVPNYLVCPTTGLETLAEEHGHHLPEDARELVRRATDSLGKLSRRLDRLDALREQAGMSPDAIDATAAVQQAVEAHKDACGEGCNLSVDWELPGKHLMVEAHESLIEAMTDLVENACQHAGPDPHLTIRADRETGGWRLSFEDDGPGIRAEHKDRVLAGLMRNGDGRGRGLGLTVASLLVERMGGRLSVEDRVRGEPAEGASLQLWLPSAVKVPPAAEPSGTGGDEALPVAEPASSFQENGFGHDQGPGMASS